MGKEISTLTANEMKKIIGGNLKKAASEIGIGATTLWRYMQGHRKPTQEIAEKIRAWGESRKDTVVDGPLPKDGTARPEKPAPAASNPVKSDPSDKERRAKEKVTSLVGQRKIVPSLALIIQILEGEIDGEVVIRLK